MKADFRGSQSPVKTREKKRTSTRAKGHRARGIPTYPNLGVGSATGVPLRGEGFALGYPRSARLDWRGVSNWLQVRFSADTRGESRRRSSTLAADFVGALRAVHMPKEKRGGFLPSKLGENLPRFSCPRQVS